MLAARAEIRRILLGLGLVACAFAALPVASASAGRLLVTGHDADLHCGSGGEQCHYVRVAADFVRGGAPDPGKPMLVLDRGALQFRDALARAGFAPGSYVVMDPQSAAFASTPLSTSDYSAILIASDASCGGCDLNTPPSATSQTPDSDVINSRSGDIAAFFNAGGGIYANSGGGHGDGTASTGPDTYYAFLPLPLGGQPVSPPFCLTSAGRALGLEDQGCPDAARRAGRLNDINCCATHNSFSEPPAGSALTVAERDLGTDGQISGDDKPETLIAEGTVSGGEITGAAPPVAGKSFNAGLVSGKIYYKCRGKKRRRLRRTTHLRMGCLIDARKGKVRIVASAGARSTKTKSSVFFSGRFKVKEKRRRKTTTDLVLSGKLVGCARSSAADRRVRDARRRKRRRGRRLWGRGRGRFRTRGRHSTATVRGTTWLVYDRCDGSTYNKVTKGKVTVRDLVRHKTIRLSKRRKVYIAKPRGR